MKKFQDGDFRVICAWCKSVLKQPLKMPRRGNPPESHGVCRACAQQMGLPDHVLAKMAS